MAKIAENFAKIPPQNIEMEQSLLGSLLIDKDAIIKVANLIRIGDFYKDIHNLIYEAMTELYEKRDPIDVLSLSNRLEEKNQLEKIGGSSYLTNLVNFVPSSSNIVHYAQVVQKKSTLRKLIQSASEIVELGYEESEDVEKVGNQTHETMGRHRHGYSRSPYILSLTNNHHDYQTTIRDLASQGRKNKTVR